MVTKEGGLDLALKYDIDSQQIQYRLGLQNTDCSRSDCPARYEGSVFVTCVKNKYKYVKKNFTFHLKWKMGNDHPAKCIKIRVIYA